MAWNLSLLDGLWLPGRERAWLCHFHHRKVDRAVGGLELVASCDGLWLPRRVRALLSHFHRLRADRAGRVAAAIGPIPL